VLQRTILNQIDVAYLLNKKKACLFPLKCAKVEDNNMKNNGSGNK